MTPFEERAFEAAAAAHARTGAPVCVHTQHGTMGLALVERLGRSACHRPRSSSRTSTGTPTRASTPRPRRPAPRSSSTARAAKYWPDSTILRLIADLAERGLADRLLLGGDTGRRGMLRAYGGGPGLDYVVRALQAAARA